MSAGDVPSLDSDGRHSPSHAAVEAAGPARALQALPLRPMYPSSTSQPATALRAPGSVSFECGIAAGLVTTAVLNPWDRALYLAVVNERPFFSRKNWKEPYRGLSQTLAQRSISSGIYFPLETMCSRAVGSHVLGGQAAGTLCGVLLNPLSFIKYQIWQHDEVRRSFVSTAVRMYRDAGLLVFVRGAFATTARDGTFGICFSLRKFFQAGSAGQGGGASDFGVAVVCAALGTTLSSPFNYLRNLAYAESTKVKRESFQAKLTFWRVHLGDLRNGAAAQDSTWNSLKFLQKRMQLGWGTARVAFGMALTDMLYKYCQHCRGDC